MASLRFERACEEYSRIRRPFYAHKLLRFYDDVTPPRSDLSLNAIDVPAEGKKEVHRPAYPTYEDERAILVSHLHPTRQDDGGPAVPQRDKRWSHLPATYADIITKYFGLNASSHADCGKLLAILFEKYDLVPKLFTTPFEASAVATSTPSTSGVGPVPDEPTTETMAFLSSREGDLGRRVSSPAHRDIQNVVAAVRKMRDVVAGRRSLLRSEQGFRLLVGEQQHTSRPESRSVTPSAAPLNLSGLGFSNPAPEFPAASNRERESPPSASVQLDISALSTACHLTKTSTVTSNPQMGITSEQMRKFKRLTKGGHLVAGGAIIQGAATSSTALATLRTTSANDTTYLDAKGRAPWKSADNGVDDRRPITSLPFNHGGIKGRAGRAPPSAAAGGGRPLSPIKLPDDGMLSVAKNTSSSSGHKNMRPEMDFAAFAQLRSPSSATT